jgi:hypothetical protein
MTSASLSRHNFSERDSSGFIVMYRSSHAFLSVSPICKCHGHAGVRAVMRFGVCVVVGHNRVRTAHVRKFPLIIPEKALVQ